MNLDELQNEVAKWSRKNFGSQISDNPLFGVCEEVGELCHAHLKGKQGIRHTPTEIRDMKLDAIGDIIIYLADYCERENLDLSLAIDVAWTVVSKRDWREK